MLIVETTKGMILKRVYGVDLRLLRVSPNNWKVFYINNIPGLDDILIAKNKKYQTALSLFLKHLKGFYCNAK